MKLVDFNRRRFLVAAIALGGAASGTVGPRVLQFSRAWAQAGSSLEDSALSALAQMARRLYPHDGVDDEVYGQIIDDALSATAADGSFADTLIAAEQALNAQQSGDFLGLDEDAQVRAMRAVEDSDFFAAIQFEVRLRVYSHPAVWEVIGYEGPSFQRGGYLNRGAGDIDWLPED